MKIKKKFNKGFTLLELLVVIAIIGILASVILLFINISRARAQDTKTKAVLNDVRTAAQEQKIDSGTYVGTCGKTSDTISSLANENNIDSQDYKCFEEQNTFAVVFPLKTTNEYWCVDSEGAAKEVEGTPTDAKPYTCESVVVNDTQSPQQNSAPVITLIGDANQTMNPNSFTEPSYTVHDQEDGTIDPQRVSMSTMYSSFYNTSGVGHYPGQGVTDPYAPGTCTYRRTYQVTDSQGATGTAQRNFSYNSSSMQNCLAMH